MKPLELNDDKSYLFSDLLRTYRLIADFQNYLK